MHKSSLILHVLQLLILTGLVVVGGYLSWQQLNRWQELQASKVRNEAIDGCAAANSYSMTQETSAGVVTFEEVSQGPFQKCLELKNVK